MGILLPENVEIADSVIFQNVRDEAVLLSLTSQEYYGLDEIGARMWSLLLERGNVDSVVAELKTIYNADETTIRADLGALVTELMDAKLLKVPGR